MPLELFLEDTYLTELKGHLADLISRVLTKPITKASENVERNKPGTSSSIELSSINSESNVEDPRVSESVPMKYSGTEVPIQVIQTTALF